MVDLHTPSGQACALSLICSLISSQLALGQDRTSLRDQQDKDRRSFEAAQRSIKGLEEAVAHSQTRIGTLETQVRRNLMVNTMGFGTRDLFAHRFV